MKTLEEFERQFPTDEACKAYIVSKRWPDGVRCPRCNSSEKIYQRKGQSYRWICCNKGCGERRGYGFSVTTATIFQDTKVPLKTWFKIGYLMLTAKKGISSLQVLGSYSARIRAPTGVQHGTSAIAGVPPCAAMPSRSLARSRPMKPTLAAKTRIAIGRRKALSSENRIQSAPTRRWAILPSHSVRSAWSGP